jgi:ESF2/ABP1 family protein
MDLNDDNSVSSYESDDNEAKTNMARFGIKSKTIDGETDSESGDESIIENETIIFKEENKVPRVELNNSEHENDSNVSEQENGSVSNSETSLYEFDDTDNPLDAESLKKFQDRLEQTGVIYFSRIPPFMKPIKLRSLLSSHGEIGRIYLNPEDPRVAARRRKYKHNKRKNFTEGWVEFADKKKARETALLLNNNIIGGKKRSFYHSDIWNVKYLPKFKWNHLSEQLAYELKVKEQKVQTEMSQARRENKMYLQNVKQSKMIKAMEEKRMKRELEQDPADRPEPKAQRKMAERNFKQRKVIHNNSATNEVSAKKSSVISKLFS